jgi:hypothetical protein
MKLVIIYQNQNTKNKIKINILDVSLLFFEQNITTFFSCSYYIHLLLNDYWILFSKDI